MKQINVLSIAVLFILASCGVYRPFSEVEKRDIPQGTSAILVDANLQKVKNAFVDEGYIVNQNSETQFQTEPRDFDYSASVYCQGFKRDGKTKVVVNVKPEGTYGKLNDDFRVTYKGNKRHRIAFSWVADIMEENNLQYQFTD